MTATHKYRRFPAFALPVTVFLACIVLSFSQAFKTHPGRLSTAIALDLLLTAPLLYGIAARKKGFEKWTLLRVFAAGLFLAGLLLSTAGSPFLTCLKNWVSPLLELFFVAFLVRKFYSARRQANRSSHFDFPRHCRQVLTTVCGSRKPANLLATEIAVFYFLFCKASAKADNQTRFSVHRANGIVLVLSTFLALFLIETAAVHFLLQLWSKTAAWIITGLGLYTCLQLLAHIRALKSRPVVVADDRLYVYNGLLGGEVAVALEDISRVELSSKIPHTPGVVKIALLKGLEKHNVALHLNKPATVLKAFGIQQRGTVLLFCVDNPDAFCQDVDARLKRNA